MLVCAAAAPAAIPAAAVPTEPAASSDPDLAGAGAF